MPADVTLLERLPEPVLLVSPTGETLYANRAFHRLAAQYGTPAKLSALFGPPAQVVLSEARRSGSANAFLPLTATSDATQGFRLAVHADSEDGTLAVQLTDLSAEVEWRHRLYMRNKELSVLNDIGGALSTTLELDALAHRIWEQTGRIMNHSNFFLALHERETNAVQFPIWVEDGEIRAGDRTRAFAGGLTEYILLSKQPLLMNGNVAAQLEQMGIARLGRPCVSFLGAPLLFDGQAQGVIALQDYERPGRFGRHELDLINIVAAQAAAAVRNARLYEATRNAYEELSNTQQKLLEGERLRGVTETVGALNHEVNNPLATIVGTAQLLVRRPDLEPGVRERVERILDGARRIQAVTAKMATLIQATSRPYPGAVAILDLGSSLAGEGDHTTLSRLMRRPDLLPEAPADDEPASPAA